MQKQVREFKSAMAYAIDSISFNPDGNCNAVVSIGTLTEDEQGGKVFKSIAQQSHYLTKEELDSLTVEMGGEEKTNVGIRSLVEIVIENHLTNKGVLGV
jgi:hypothetical protein